MLWIECFDKQKQTSKEKIVNAWIIDGFHIESIDKDIYHNISK